MMSLSNLSALQRGSWDSGGGPWGGVVRAVDDHRESERQVRLKEIFDEIDMDGNGTLDRSELAELFSRSHDENTQMSEEALDTVMEELLELSAVSSPTNSMSSMNSEDPASRDLVEVDFEHFVTWYMKHSKGEHGFMQMIEEQVEFNALKTLKGPFIAIAVEYTGLAMLMPILAWFVFEHGGNPTWVGVIMSAQYLAGVLGQLIGGFISDKVGVKKTCAVIMLADVVTFAAQDS